MVSRSLWGSPILVTRTLVTSGSDTGSHSPVGLLLIPPSGRACILRSRARDCCSPLCTLTKKTPHKNQEMWTQLQEFINSTAICSRWSICGMLCRVSLGNTLHGFQIFSSHLWIPPWCWGLAFLGFASLLLPSGGGRATWEVFTVFAHSWKAAAALLEMCCWKGLHCDGRAVEFQVDQEVVCNIHRQEIALLRKTLVLPIDMSSKATRQGEHCPLRASWTYQLLSLVSWEEVVVFIIPQPREHHAAGVT